MNEQEQIVRIQRTIMKVLREYKARGIEAVEEDVLHAEVERRLGEKIPR